MLTVHWNAAKALTYDLEGVGTNTYVVSDLNAQFGATTVYWGFTSSTGGKYQENAFSNDTNSYQRYVWRPLA